MSDNTKNANVNVDETGTDNTNESQISEAQEQMLDAEPTTEQQQAFEAISEKFENSEVDDSDLLGFVSAGTITESQLVEMRGLTFAELQESEAKADDKPKPMSFDQAWEKISGMINDSDGKTNEAGALAVVTGWFMRNEITKETHEQISQLLNTDNSKDATTNPFAEMLAEMKANYKPALEDLEACKKAAENIAGVIVQKNIELEGTHVSRMIAVFADIAYHLAKKGELTITRRGDDNVTIGEDGTVKGVPWSGTTHQLLWNAIKRGNMLGEVKEATGEKMGTRVTRLGKIYDPYAEIAPQKDNICKRAVLFAFGHVTKVQFGYMAKRSAQGRPSKLTKFEASVEDEKGYFKSLCLPANIVTPMKNQMVIKDMAGQDIMGLHLEGGEENDNQSLVWLANDILEPLYQHLHGHELEYYLADKTNSGIPTGSIIGSHDPRFGKNRVRESTAKLLETAKADLAKATTERDALAKGLEKENRTSSLQAIEAYISNKNMPVDDNELYHAVALASVAFERATTNGKVPSQEFLKLALEFRRKIETVIIDDPDKEPVYKSPRGDAAAVPITGIRRNIAA